MRLRAMLRTLLVLAATAACVRLGLWQLSRLGEKRTLHAAERADNTRRMPQVASDGGLVAEKPDTAPAKKRREPRNQNVEARQDGGHGSL